MPRRADTSWHEAFLARVAEGMAFQPAARAVGVAYKTLYHHFKIDPEFRAQANEIRSPRYQADTSWHDRLPAMTAAGLTKAEAAERLGINRWTIWWHSQTYSRLRKAIETAQQPHGGPMTGHAYEAEKTDVEAIVATELGDVTDLLERYHRAGAAQELHAVASEAFAAERARTVLAMHEEGGLSFQDIADVTLIGTKGRVQQLIEKARKRAGNGS